MNDTASRHQEFEAYFKQEVAEKAARSLSDGIEIGITVGEETFTFTRQDRCNAIVARAPKDPQVEFRMSQNAATSILNFKSDSIGEIGVHIMKQIITKNEDQRVSVKLHAGFLKLLSKGYFGVLTAGGAGVASFLASRGLGATSGIKNVIKKLKS